MPFPVERPIGPVPPPQDWQFLSSLFEGHAGEMSAKSFTDLYGLLCNRMEAELCDVMCIPENERA
eukprot:8239629-Pyramimonas_sp.AAC.1